MPETVSNSSSSDEIERLRTQLRQTESRLAEAQSIGQLGYWEQDFTNDRHAWWSDETYRIFGVPRDGTALTFERFLECIHPDDRQLLRDSAKESLATGVVSSFAYRIRRPNGSERIISARAGVVTNESGAPIRLAGTVQDITERTHLQQALFESEARCRQIFDRVPLGIVVVNTDRRFIKVNQAWVRMTGYSAEELERMTTLDLTYPDDRVLSLRILADAKAGTLSEFVLEKRYVRKNGEMFWGHTSAAAVRDEQGADMEWVVIIEDISDSVAAECRRAEQRMVQREALVREVNHRIKNHLQGVSGLLERHATAKPALEPMIEEILAQLNVLATVYGLQSEISGREVNLCNIVRSILDTLRTVSTMPLEFSLEEDFVPVELNAQEGVPIALIVNELIANAVKHVIPSVKQDGVTIQMQRDGLRAAIVVRNAPARLPPGFDFAGGQFLGTGLRLVRSLLPGDGASLSFRQSAPDVVEVTLELWPPAINPAVASVSKG